MTYKKIIIFFVFFMNCNIDASQQACISQQEKQTDQVVRSQKRVQFESLPDQEDFSRLNYLIKSMHELDDFQDQISLTSTNLDDVMQTHFVLRNNDFQEKLYEACLHAALALHNISIGTFYKRNKLEQEKMLADCLNNHDDAIHVYMYGNEFVQHVKNLENKPKMQK